MRNKANERRYNFVDINCLCALDSFTRMAKSIMSEVNIYYPQKADRRLLFFCFRFLSDLNDKIFSFDVVINGNK